MTHYNSPPWYNPPKKSAPPTKTLIERETKRAAETKVLQERAATAVTAAKSNRTDLDQNKNERTKTIAMASIIDGAINKATNEIKLATISESVARYNHLKNQLQCHFCNCTPDTLPALDDPTVKSITNNIAFDASNHNIHNGWVRSNSGDFTACVRCMFNTAVQIVSPYHTYTSVTALVATEPKVSTDILLLAHPTALKAALEELTAYNTKAPKGFKLNHRFLSQEITRQLRTQVSPDIKIYSDAEYKQWVEYQKLSTTKSTTKRKATPGLSPRRHPRANNNNTASPTSPEYSPGTPKHSPLREHMFADSESDDDLDSKSNNNTNNKREKENDPENANF